MIRSSVLVTTPRPPPLSFLMLLLLLFVGLVPIESFSAASSSSSKRLDSECPSLRVCTNKDCRKRFGAKAFNLEKTLEQLLAGPASPATPGGSTATPTLPHFSVETTGCLSQCGHGPNVSLRKKDGTEELLHGLSDATAAVAALEVADTSFRIHPTLLAAVNVMEKAHKGLYLICLCVCICVLSAFFSTLPALFSSIRLARSRVADQDKYGKNRAIPESGATWSREKRQGMILRWNQFSSTQRRGFLIYDNLLCFLLRLLVLCCASCRGALALFAIW